jgi:hypothetical protein
MVAAQLLLLLGQTGVEQHVMLVSTSSRQLVVVVVVSCLPRSSSSSSSSSTTEVALQIDQDGQMPPERARLPGCCML